MIEEKPLEMVIFYFLVAPIFWYLLKFAMSDCDIPFSMWMNSSVLNNKYVEKNDSLLWDSIKTIVEFFPKNNTKK